MRSPCRWIWRTCGGNERLEGMLLGLAAGDALGPLHRMAVRRRYAAQGIWHDCGSRRPGNFSKAGEDFRTDTQFTFWTVECLPRPRPARLRCARQDLCRAQRPVRLVWAAIRRAHFTKPLPSGCGPDRPWCMNVPGNPRPGWPRQWQRDAGLAPLVFAALAFAYFRRSMPIWRLGRVF